MMLLVCASSMTGRNLAWLPNSLTVLRLVLSLALPGCPAESQFWILLVAGVTDGIDGWLSRQLGATSAFGQIVDPIADKTLAFSALGVAVASGWLTPLQLLGVAARDLGVLLLCAIALCRAQSNWSRMTPRLSGKLATAGQIVALLVV